MGDGSLAEGNLLKLLGINVLGASRSQDVRKLVGAEIAWQTECAAREKAALAYGSEGTHMPKLVNPGMPTPEIVLGVAVVTANRFNPSVISQIWLVKNGLAGENDFGRVCIFTPDLVQVETTTFNLACSAEQMQFAPVGDRSQWGHLALEGLGKILQALPHTPFTAIGLNFVWQLRLPTDVAGPATRRAFKGASVLYRHFETPDARFGAYLSKDYDDMRLRLNVAPVASSKEEKAEGLQLNFNFHRLVRDQPLEEMLGVLSKWDSALSHSKQICDEVQSEVDS